MPVADLAIEADAIKPSRPAVDYQDLIGSGQAGDETDGVSHHDPAGLVLEKGFAVDTKEAAVAVVTVLRVIHQAVQVDTTRGVAVLELDRVALD